MPAHHVARVPPGRACQRTAPTQGLQAVCPPLPVLQAEDGVGELPHAGGGPVGVAAAGRRARSAKRLRLWRKAHAERKRNECGDSEAAKNAT